MTISRRSWHFLSRSAWTDRVLVSAGLTLLLVGQPGNSAGQTNRGTQNLRSGQGAGQSFVDSLSFADRRQPIDIRSGSLEFLYAEKRVQYQDKVVVTQGKVTLTCNLLTVTYEDLSQSKSTTQPSSPSPTSQQRLKEVIAEGDVRLQAENGYATGQKFIFDQDKRTVILSGNVVLREGANQVSGDRVSVYLDERRSVVEGRARMRLIPQSDNAPGTTSQ